MSPITLPAPRVRGRVHLAVFLALVAGISFATYRAYVEEERVFRESLHKQLEDLAALKFNQVYNWQLERRGDIEVAALSGASIPELARAVRPHANPADKEHATAWLDKILKSYKYSGGAVLDASGKMSLLAGHLLAEPEFYEEISTHEMSGKDILFTYYPQAPGMVKSHFALMARLHSPDGIFGTIVLVADPWVFPFPDVLAWGSPTRTGSIFMVRREGQTVRAIGFMRGDPQKPIELTVSLSEKESPFVKAASAGNGVVDGIDVGGAKFVAEAVTHSVGARPLTMMSMVEEGEAYEPLRHTRLLLMLASGLLIAFCGAGVGWIWRQQVAESYRLQLDAEQERRELIGHYDYLTRFANDAVFLSEPDGKILQVNERGSDFYGYSRDELLRMSVFQLRPAGEDAEVRRAMAELEEKKSLVWKTTGRRKDGSMFPVELSIRMVDVDGAQYRQTIVRDITERQRAEEQIGRLNRLYAVLSRCGQAIVNAPGEAALFQEVCDIAVGSGGFRAASIRVLDGKTGWREAAAWAGEGVTHPDNLPGESPADAMAEKPGDGRIFVCNDLWDEPSMAGWKAMAEKYNFRSLLSLPLWRGGRLAGEMRLYSAEQGFFNEGETKLASEIAESICFALESLERKRKQQNIEAELRSSRERLELVLDATEEAYWDWELESGEVQISPRYDAMLGYGPQELPRGLHAWMSMVHPEDAGTLESGTQKLRDSGTDTLAQEFRMRCKSGEYIWVFARGKVVGRDANGKPRRMLGTLTDVTDRKKLEEQFRQAQKLESVGRLAGGVAHDFNNLLTVINGYSGLLLARMPRKDPSRPQLEEIRKAGERAEELTRQLLTFSRKQVTEVRLLKLNEAVTESARMLRRLVPENVEFRTFAEAEVDAVVTDPGQVHQVVMNLVVNACDAMPGGGRLTVSTANVEVNSKDVTEEPDIVSGPYIQLTVADTGTGMDEETLHHVFEPFFTTKEVGKGTGLGLSTVYGIVRQCHGFVQVESAIGQGSTFRIYLPVAGEGIRPHTAATQVDEASLHGTATVLVVEDQESVRNLAVESLRTYGYSVIAARSGAEALEITRRGEGNIDLLLTDVVMPAMNGRELAREIREMRPAIKVIFMSGYEDDAVSGGNETGAEAGYLQKPFSPEALALKVRDTLRHSAVSRTILVVEDEEGVRSLLLEHLGQKHTVMLANDGAEALRILAAEEDIDLVITDLVMPKQEGIEVIRAVRKLRPKVRIIAMSGAFGGQFLKTAEMLGADATLVKPIRPEVLEEVIEEVLGRPVR